MKHTLNPKVPWGPIGISLPTSGKKCSQHDWPSDRKGQHLKQLASSSLEKNVVLPGVMEDS